MAVTGTPRMVTDGLVLHFDAANVKSYPGSGTTWTDLSPTAASASLLNGPVFRNTAGGSIWFDSTNDYIPTNLTTNYQRFTVAAWVYAVPSTATGIAQEIVSKRYFFAFMTNDWPTALQINVSGSNAVTGSCSFLVSSGSAYSITEGVNGRSLSNVRITANAWNYIVGSYDGSLVKLYVNGVLGASGSYSGNVSTGNTFPWTFGRPNAYNGAGTGWYYMTGSLAIVSLYNRGLTDVEVLQNYESTSERFNRPTIVTDYDALAFLNVTNILDETQQSAINTLVTELKNAGLWTKMKAIYPFVGGTASTHKYNLKDPRDLDAAFRLQFNGGWTHSSTGATPNGTNGYADTYLTPTTHLIENSTHMSFYSRTNQFEVGVEMGIYKSTTSPAGLHTLQVGSLADGVDPYQSYSSYSTSDFVALFYPQGTTVTTTGMYIGTRTSGTYQRLFRNNAAIATDTTSTAGWSAGNLKVFIGNRNADGSPDAGQYSVKECAFSTIGDGLTDADAANLYTIVQKYQTTLGRQV